MGSTAAATTTTRGPSRSPWSFHPTLEPTTTECVLQLHSIYAQQQQHQWIITIMFIDKQFPSCDDNKRRRMGSTTTRGPCASASSLDPTVRPATTECVLQHHSIFSHAAQQQWIITIIMSYDNQSPLSWLHNAIVSLPRHAACGCDVSLAVQ